LRCELTCGVFCKEEVITESGQILKQFNEYKFYLKLLVAWPVLPTTYVETPVHKTEKYLKFKHTVLNDATHASLNTILVINDVMHNSEFEFSCMQFIVHSVLGLTFTSVRNLISFMSLKKKELQLCNMNQQVALFSNNLFQ
jgi:hypothetical protein